MTSPATVNAILEPFMMCTNDHSGASTNSMEFSARILASLPKLAAAGPGLPGALLALASVPDPSSAFAPVLQFLGPDILTRMGFSSAEKSIFVCWTGMKFYVAEAAKAGLRAFTDPDAMCAAMAQDPVIQRLAFATTGPSAAFNGRAYSAYFEALGSVYKDIASVQDPTATARGMSVPAGLLLQDLRADLQTTMVVRHSLGSRLWDDTGITTFMQTVVSGISTCRLGFHLRTVSQVFRRPFFSDPAAATRAAGVLKNLDSKLSDVCSGIFGRTMKLEGPLSASRLVLTEAKDAAVVCFSPIVSTVITLSWHMGAGLEASGFPEQMPFVRNSGSVVLCMAEAQEAASRVGPMMARMSGIPDGRTYRGILERVDLLTSIFQWSADAPLNMMLHDPQLGGPGVARTTLLLAPIARRCLNLTLPHLDFSTGRMALDCIGCVSGVTLRLFRGGALSAGDLGLLLPELVRPISALPKRILDATCLPDGAPLPPSMAFFQVLHLTCLAARDPAALVTLRRSFGDFKKVSTGEALDHALAKGFLSMAETGFTNSALWGWGALALGQSTDRNQVRRHFTQKRLAGLINEAGRSQRPGSHQNDPRTTPQSSLLVGLASILQNYMLGPGIEGAGGRCWDIWGREDVNLGPLLDAIALGPVPHGTDAEQAFGFGTSIYQPYTEILALIGKTLHLARSAARGRVRAGLLGPEAERRVEKLDRWRQRAREVNRTFLFRLLPKAEAEDDVRRMGARDGAGRVASLEDLLRELDAVGGDMKV